MQKNKSKDLVVNTIIIGIGKFSTQIVSFLLLPLYTSILSTEEYGVYDLLITISTFLLPVITLLMEESMFRFLIDCKDNNEKKKVISQTTIYVIISLIIFLLLATILNKIITISYFTVGIIYIISCIISALRNSLLRGLGKIKFYTIINFISSVIDIILKVVFIAVFKFGVYGLLVPIIIANILSSIFVFLYLKLYKYTSFKSYDNDLMKKMIKYSIPLVPNSLSWTIVNLSDRLVISSVIGTAANGIYSIAYKFPNIIDTVYGFFYTAWKESAAKAVIDNDKNEFFNKIFKNLSKIMFSVSIGLIGSMPLIFNIFINNTYKEAYVYIPILVIAMYFNNMAGYFGGIFSAYKNTKIMGTTTVIGSIINIIVDLLLIKFIGVYAAAISTLISCVFIYYYRKSKVKKYIILDKVNIKIGLLILILTLLLYYINKNIIIKILNILVIMIYIIIINKEILKLFIENIIKKVKN